MRITRREAEDALELPNVQAFLRVIRESESLALIFNFITVDAEQSIGEQHHAIRRMFRECEERPWSDWNAEAFGEWLASRDREK